MGQIGQVQNTGGAGVRVKYGVKYRYTRVNFPSWGHGLGSKKGALTTYDPIHPLRQAR